MLTGLSAIGVAIAIASASAALAMWYMKTKNADIQL